MYESSNFKCLQFLRCLHFAVVNSEYVSVLLKPKQAVCLEAAYLGRDLLAVCQLATENRSFFICLLHC